MATLFAHDWPQSLLRPGSELLGPIHSVVPPPAPQSVVVATTPVVIEPPPQEIDLDFSPPEAPRWRVDP